MNITILLPCLNEAETIELVIRKAQASLRSLSIVGEVLVADNGSTDGSQSIALTCGARVISVPTRGYGAALIAGIKDCKSEYIIMGDADDSYAFDDLSQFVRELNDGNQLVIGNRFQGGIHPGAMPWLHKYIGNPILSFLGKLLYKVPIGDFHCGLRAFHVNSIRNLNLISPGMEFASEMIVKAQLQGLRIVEVPTTLKPDGRSRRPHLRTWRDGWRHLIFLLAGSPRWLFLYPGIFLTLMGVVGVASTFNRSIRILGLALEINSYFIFIGLILTGVQIILFGILARLFSSNFGILPTTKKLNRFAKIFTLERGILLGMTMVLVALGIFLFLLSHWTGERLNGIELRHALRLSGLIVVLSGVGTQVLFSSFFASILKVK